MHAIKRRHKPLTSNTRHTGNKMEATQFQFSLFVGISLTLVGSAIASSASVGISLMAMGVAIIALALMTKNKRGDNCRQPILLTADSHQAKDTFRKH